MRCRDIIGVLDGLCPESLACSWDNPGLLCGRMDKEVKRIFVALDATDRVVDAAIAWGADLLLTHHPLLFKAVKQVNDQNFITRRVLRLIQCDISYYAMHTNFDAAPGCMADQAAARLGVHETAPLETLGVLTGADGAEIPYGIGRTGFLKEERSLAALSGQVKEVFGLPYVEVYGPALLEKRIRKVAICPGSGGSEVEAALRAGAEVLITGDIGHHTGIDANAQGLAIIDGGHYGIEKLFIPFLEAYLKERLGEGIAIRTADPEWPTILFA